MTEVVVFDAVYRKEVDGRIATPNLAELRYVIARVDSASVADEYVSYVREIVVTEQRVDDLWHEVSEIKRRYSPSLGDAYALATARDLEDDGAPVTLLVGADDDFDRTALDEPYATLIERFREDGA